MGTQTMGSNGATQKPMFDGLSRQGSLYNLTLDEVQQQLGDLGKPFSSMNLDEFLKNVWSAEANQGTNSTSPELTQLASASSLPRQLSLNFTKDLTKKTVDQVWQDIQHSQKKNNGNESETNINSSSSCKRQPTLGEMTLEDFLVKAGIVAESSPTEKNQEQNLDQQWMHYQIPQIQQQHVVMSGHYQAPQPINVAGNPMIDSTGYLETRMTMSPPPLMGNVSDFGRKRPPSGDVVEKTVERRQKRMIKNRESAARSRARKQAYTHELENKISRLEEENESLRKQKEVLPCVPPPPPQPKYQLRRTTSASF
ncbi:hypothetical protein LXL04_036189 [Taraxacum kok-saghyz]